MSASNNNITGDTNAKVTGSTLSVAGSDSTDDLIAVNHGIKDGTMISKAVSNNTWSAGGLADNRTTENLSGIVIDASSTHGLSSDVASLTVQLGDKGANLAGSLNFVKISGATNAAFDNSSNAAIDGKAGSLNVGAFDYTNKGGCIGGAAGAANFAAGASVGVTDVARDVTASVNNTGANVLDIAADNFNVNAVSRQGISDFMLNATVAVNEQLALETADNAASNANTSNTAAKVIGVKVNYGGEANIGAEHTPDANVLNVAAGVSIALDPQSGVAGSLNTGIAVTQDKATVSNEIRGAELIGGDVSKAKISAVNSSRINNDLFSIGGAVSLLGAGVAGDIAVNSLNTTTQSTIENSTVKAGTIEVTTADKVSPETDGGAGSFGGLAGVGAAVDVNTINNTTNANITGSTLEATDALTVDTKETRTFDSTLAAAGLGSVGAAVNVMTTTVNASVGETDSAVTRKLIEGHFEKANAELIDTDQIHGLSTSDKATLKESQGKIKVTTEAVSNKGVLTNVAGSTLKAGGALKINSTEQNDAAMVNGSGSLGGLGVAVGDNILHINHKTNTLLTTSDISGGTVDIGATQTQANKGLETNVYEVGVGVLEVGVGYNSVQLKGDTQVNVKGSNISATSGTMALTATDDSKTKVENFGLNVGAVGVPVTTAKSVNESVTQVVIENSARENGLNSDLSATGDLNVKARSANEAYVKAKSASGGGAVVATTASTARDNNKALVAVLDGNNRFGGSTVSLTAESDPSVSTYAPAGSIQGAGLTMVTSETELKGGAEVEVCGGNRFDAATVNYKATTGSADRTAAYSEMFSINGGAISIDGSKNGATVKTETTTNVEVGSQTYNADTAINVESILQPNRHAYAEGYAIGIAASSGQDAADVTAKDSVTAEIGSGALENKAGSLTVTATNKNVTDVKATGGAGALLDIASESKTDNDSLIDVTATVGGKWNVGGAVSINATSDDTIRGYVRQGHGGLAGGAAVNADNNISGTTTATVDENASINAGTIEVNALNKFKTDGYKGAESYLLADYYGGAIEIDNITSKVTVKKNAYTDVGENASITTTGAQTYTAKSDGDVMNKVNAAGGGLINGLSADANTAITTDNQVRFASGSKATGESDFTVKAFDVLNVDSASSGTNGGVVAFLFNGTKNDIDRKNVIDVKGALTTAGNVEMEAGGTKDAFFDDKTRQIYIKTVTETNNYTAYEVNSPAAKYTLKENNAINVDGSIDSGRDINMRADGGKVEVLYSSRSGQYSNLEKYTGVGVPDLSNADKNVERGTYATNILGTGGDESGKEEDGVNTNFIAIDGRVTAGSAVKDVAVNISGRVIPDEYNIQGTTNSGKLTVSSDIDIDYTEGTIDYANELSTRRQTLIDLVNQYTTGASTEENNTAAVAGFLAEIERVESKMRELGLAVDEGGHTSVISEGVEVRYIELGDISLSGGNVNLNTAKVKGTGTLTAKGAPNLTITNTSNAYLRVNDIRLGGESGNVNLKGHAVMTGDAGVATTLKLDTAMQSGAGNVTIYNNPDIARVNLVDKSDTSQTGTYDPRPDLRLMGDIENVNGDVRVTNTRGDIDISSDYEREESGVVTGTTNSANINARNIYIEANGTINQGFVEGLVNVGGTPESILRAEATAAQNKASAELNKTASSDTKTYVVKENAVEGGDTGNGRIAGNNIYLAALDININGVLQAGYETYRVTVADADIETLKAELANNDTSALDQRMKDSSGRYAVNAAGAKYSASKGYYDYELPVYYDATEDKLIMESLETGGGNIYLSGRIASTGSGKIYAANGYATIDIENKSDLPMEVGRIINNDRRGKITIIDTALDTLTEYTPGQTRVIENYAQMLKEHFADGRLYETAQVSDNDLDELNPTTGAYNTTTYQPASGLRYNWTQGEATTTDQIYHHEETGWGVLFSENWLGQLLFGSTKNTVEEWEKDTTPRTTSGSSTLDVGGFLTGDGSTDDSLNLKAESVLMNTTGPILIAKDTKVKSYLVAKKYTYTLDWKYIQGSIQSYTFDINASKPITVGFLGRTHGPITVNSNGSLYLNGDMQMSDGESQFGLYSNHGGIYQAGETVLRAGNATVHAFNDISGLNLETIGRRQANGTYDDTLELNVVSSNGGDIDINVTGAVYIGNEGLRSQTADSGARGNITLKATGQITGLNGATGKTIVITSENGGVGSNNATKSSQANSVAMRLDATNAVEVNAKGNIYLGTPSNGTLNIGKVASTNGEVHITRNGLQSKVAQAASYQSGVGYADDETLIHQWIDQGIIAPTEDYAGTYFEGLKARVTEYEEQIGEEYATYESGKEAYANLKSVTATEYAEYESIKGSYAEYVEEIDAEFSEYLDETAKIRAECASEYTTMLNYQAKKAANEEAPAHNKALTKNQMKKLEEYEAKYAGYDSADGYYIVNARTLVTEPDYQKFVGYDDIDAYMLTTRQGQLMSKYSDYESAAAYLATTAGYALEQKYGGYADVASYLATDAQYKALIEARDNPKYASTLEAMLEQAEIERAAATLDIDAKHYYIDNQRII